MQLLGHDGPPIGMWKENLLNGAALQECPMMTVLRLRDTTAGVELDRLLKLHKNFTRGVMLVAGGMADQPARFLDVMQLIDETHEQTQAKATDIRNKNDAPD